MDKIQVLVIFADCVYQLTIGLSNFERTMQYLENVATLSISNTPDNTLKQNILRKSGAGKILNPINLKVNLIRLIIS